MDIELRNELQVINLKLSHYQWYLDQGTMDSNGREWLKTKIESLKDRKSSLNAFRLS